MAYKFFIQKKEGYKNPPVKNPKNYTYKVDANITNYFCKTILITKFTEISYFTDRL